MVSTLSDEALSAIILGYCTCIEWAPSDEGENEELLSYDVERTAPRHVLEFIGRCAVAGVDYVAAIESIGYSRERLGHDFWLSRNGHGAGFFDRDELPKALRDALQCVAEACGAAETYIDDDGALRLDR